MQSMTWHKPPPHRHNFSPLQGHSNRTRYGLRYDSVKHVGTLLPTRPRAGYLHGISLSGMLIPLPFSGRSIRFKTAKLVVCVLGTGTLLPSPTFSFRPLSSGHGIKIPVVCVIRSKRTCIAARQLLTQVCAVPWFGGSGERITLTRCKHGTQYLFCWD